MAAHDTGAGVEEEDTVEACVALFERLGLGRHTEAIRHHGIDIATLRDLAETDGLAELGVTSKIESSKIRATLKKLNAGGAATAAAPTTTAAAAPSAANTSGAVAAASQQVPSAAGMYANANANASPYSHRVGMRLVNMSRDPKLDDEYPPCLKPWRAAVTEDDWSAFIEDTNTSLKKYRTNGTDTALMGAAPLVLPMIPLVMRQTKREKKVKAVLENAATRFNTEYSPRCGFKMVVDSKASSSGELRLELAGEALAGDGGAVPSA